MIFHWDDENRTHLARHAVSSSQAEAAFEAEDALLFQDATRLNPVSTAGSWKPRWKAGSSRSHLPECFPKASESSQPTG